MEKQARTWNLGQLAAALGAELDGDPQHTITHPVGADSDDPDGLAFAENEKFLAVARDHQAGALIVPHGTAMPGRNLLRVAKPRMAFAMFLHMNIRPLEIETGIHPTAVIADSAQIDPSASIGPYVVIQRNVVVGPGCRIHAHCFVGDGCRLAEKVVLYPQVVLVQDVSIGARSVLFPHVVVGADGFGYVWDGQKRVKIPQVGGVEIGADVEIGAGTTIDRAMSSVTRIGDGTKLDNLIQVGHNVRIGDHAVVAAMSAFGGSATLGDRAMVGGSTAVKDNVAIGDDVVLAGRTGAMRDIDAPGEYFGLPALPIREAMRQMAALQKLPDLIKQVRHLEAELERLKQS